MSGRYYKIKDRDYVSVTTIIKDVLNAPQLTAWRVREGIKTALEQVKVNPNITMEEVLQIEKDKLNKTGERGTSVHTLIANAKSQKIDIKTVMTPEYVGYIECYNKWIDDIKPLPPILIEKEVHHPDFYYAGTLDGVYPIEIGAMVTDFDKGITKPLTVNILVDIKTGFVNDITGTQLTFYEYALAQNLPELDIYEKRILKLSKDGSYNRDENWIKTEESFKFCKYMLALWRRYYASKKFNRQWVN